MARSVIVVFALLLTVIPARAETLDSAWEFSALFLQNMLERDDRMWPDSVKRRWFNESFSKMEKYSVIQKVTTIQMTAGTRKYEMPSDYVQDGFWSAYYKYEKSPSGVEEAWYWWGALRIKPGLFNPAKEKQKVRISVWGDSVTVVPEPSDADLLEIEYAAEVMRFYSETDTTNLPKKYRETAVNYACYKAENAAHP